MVHQFDTHPLSRKILPHPTFLTQQKETETTKTHEGTCSTKTNINKSTMFINCFHHSLQVFLVHQMLFVRFFLSTDHRNANNPLGVPPCVVVVLFHLHLKLTVLAPVEVGTLQGINVSHQTGKGKSSTQKGLGRGYVSFQEGSISHLLRWVLAPWQVVQEWDV